MLIFTRSLRVVLAVDPVDLRKTFVGLPAQVQHALEEDERPSQVLVFTNKRRDRVRMLYWDGTGLWLLTKRLEAGTFNWPKTSAELGADRGKINPRGHLHCLFTTLPSISAPNAGLFPPGRLRRHACPRRAPRRPRLSRGAHTVGQKCGSTAFMRFHGTLTLRRQTQARWSIQWISQDVSSRLIATARCGPACRVVWEG